MVQNGRAEYDPSTTIKAAIDGSIYRGGKWDSFKDDRQRQYVRYTVTITDRKRLDEIIDPIDFDKTFFKTMINVSSSDYLGLKNYYLGEFENTYKLLESVNWIVPIHDGYYTYGRFAASKELFDSFFSWYVNTLVPGFTELQSVEGIDVVRYNTVTVGGFQTGKPEKTAEYPVLNYDALMNLNSATQIFNPGDITEYTVYLGWLISDENSFEFLNGNEYWIYELDDGKKTRIRSENAIILAGSLLHTIYNR
jgi:hypothetical protein